ncbi:MAG: glycosyltransferase family 61 protein [Myxococcales bacterium FL481]|nr:MAG: glycosyltransferase family 61 protein [Myxococcales bacterium FL481]
MPEIEYQVRTECTEALPLSAELGLGSQSDQDRIWVYEPSGMMPLHIPEFIDNVHHTSNQVARYLRYVTEAEYPPVAYAILHNAKLVNNWMLLDRHDRHYPELIPHYVEDLRKPADGSSREGATGRLTFDSTRHVSGDSLLLNMGAAHISHFFYEALVNVAPLLGASLKLIYHVSPWDAFHQLFEMLGFARDNSLEKSWDPRGQGRLHDAECWTFDRLIVPYYTARICPVHMPMFGVMRLGVPPKADRLIYISRQDSRSLRVMLNEDEVVQMMARNGFSVLKFSELSEREKIAYVTGAKLMVQPNGAANFYSAFCGHSLDCNVLLNGGAFDLSHPRLLASMGGFRHGVFMGPDFMSYDARGHKGECCDFVLDVPQLERRVGSLLDRIR